MVSSIQGRGSGGSGTIGHRIEICWLQLRGLGKSKVVLGLGV